jgi:hypothetical protein
MRTIKELSVLLILWIAVTVELVMLVYGMAVGLGAGSF